MHAKFKICGQLDILTCNPGIGIFINCFGTNWSSFARLDCLKPCWISRENFNRWLWHYGYSVKIMLKNRQFLILIPRLTGDMWGCKKKKLKTEFCRCPPEKIKIYLLDESELRVLLNLRHFLSKFMYLLFHMAS